LVGVTVAAWFSSVLLLGRGCSDNRGFDSRRRGSKDRRDGRVSMVISASRISRVSYLAE
jgi:hypothetical protein